VGTPDEVVVTTTDYLPGHSEKRTISKIDGDGKVILSAGVTWPHRGTRFPLKSRLGTNEQRFLDAGMDPDLITNGAETRAAVALLTRSIRIVSGGDGPNTPFDPVNTGSSTCQGVGDLPKGLTCYSFGAHVVFRQGFKTVQIQGVEFAKLGQPGKMGHYPVHFHMAREVPPNTFIKDSTINESMTRWIVLHSTQGVLLQRNIGYKSIGHGFYLESGTETDNKFYSNLGIFARAAVDNPQNPRKLPGILGYTGENFKPFQEKGKPVVAPLPADAFPWRTDYQHPTVFWITNGWNDFIGNMAAGAGACGAAYWFVPAWNSDMPDVKTSSNVEFKTHMKWDGFAALQKDLSLAGSTPLKSFYGNYATSTMTSFQTIATTAPCPGPDWPGDPLAKAPGHFPGIASFAPTPEAPVNTEDDMYYPHIGGGGRMATKCPLKVKGDPSKGYNCTDFTSGQISSCNNGKALATCAVTVLDHFTSSFHWAETNFSAIWLRPQWYLVDNSVLTDVQNGGLSFITSGTYDRSAVVDGDWAVVRTSVFVGNTQKEGTNSFASNLTPFQHTLKPGDGLPCGNGNQPSLMCASRPEGVSFPMSNFGVSQRLFSIYDGPAYQESNIYLDINTAPCEQCVYSRLPSIRKETKTDKTVSCYLPNAAIGWKQPNGFFYPPSFHSSNLFFDNVQIRHYVIDALFKKNTYLDDAGVNGEIQKDYCDFSGTFPSFGNFSDIDRQTELSDDDGTLTGLLGVSKVKVNGVEKDKLNDTISVNPVDFFNAPVETAECLSNIGVTGALACPVNKVLPKTPTPAGAKTSPYDYVTTVVFPECGIGPLPESSKEIQRKCKDDNYNEGGGTRFPHQLGRGGDWSQECSNPACYGVPLYRQFLTGTSASRELQTWNKDCSTDTQRETDACRWPFVRMGGQSTYQRSTLTANHGTYFLDTSVSRKTQWTGEAFTTTKPCDDPSVKPSDDCHQRSVNVFKGGQTYYMFFLFAKPETKQTYQIYVGQGFTLKDNPDDPDSDLHAISPVLDSMPMPSIASAKWPSKWKAVYNNDAACGKGKAGCGVLQVTVDFSGQTDLDPKSQCKPATFCKVKDGGACGCSLEDNDPLAVADPARKDSTGTNVLFGGILGACEKACSQWAVKDLDFPGKGPLGFSFKMPANFTADDKGWSHRPSPTAFPSTQDTGQPDWLTTFINSAIEPDHSKGDCHYASLPTNSTGSCQIP
jgi:cell migration-inducing and hyaluronan-binding protein